MITIKLTRDQARVLEKDFIPYMIKIAVVCIANVESMGADYLHWKIILSLLMDVQLIFKRKLLSKSNNLTFKLSEAHGIALYGLLMKKPVDAQLVYINVMRQKLCDDIHKQLLHPLAEMEEEFG